MRSFAFVVLYFKIAFPTHNRNREMAFLHYNFILCFFGYSSSSSSSSIVYVVALGEHLYRTRLARPWRKITTPKNGKLFNGNDKIKIFRSNSNSRHDTTHTNATHSLVHEKREKKKAEQKAHRKYLNWNNSNSNRVNSWRNGKWTYSA